VQIKNNGIYQIFLRLPVSILLETIELIGVLFPIYFDEIFSTAERPSTTLMTFAYVVGRIN